MAKIVPPPVISFSARCVKSSSDQHDTSIAVRKPSRGQSVTRPSSACRGANAMECTRIEPPPLRGDHLEQRIGLRRLADLQRQQQRRIDRQSQWLDIGPCLVVEKVIAISAPDRCIASAHPHAIERSLATPTINALCPFRIEEWLTSGGKLCTSVSGSLLRRSCVERPPQGWQRRRTHGE